MIIQRDQTRNLGNQNTLSSSAAVIQHLSGTPSSRRPFKHYAFSLNANICRIPTLSRRVLRLLHVAGQPAHDKFRSLFSVLLKLFLFIDIPQPFQLSFLWLKLLAGQKDH